MAARGWEGDRRKVRRRVSGGEQARRVSGQGLDTSAARERERERAQGRVQSGAKIANPSAHHTQQAGGEGQAGHSNQASASTRTGWSLAQLLSRPTLPRPPPPTLPLPHAP